MNLNDRLRERGLSLPSPMTPAGNYVPSVRAGDLLFLAGQIARRDGQVLSPGLLGAGVSIDQGRSAAQAAVLNALAVIQEAIGDLDHVVRVVRMTVYVASSPGFVDQAQVADGASDLLVDLFGERGRHARSAVGMAALPLGSPVEVELTVQVT
ncbi:MAG: RidA family protein [Chloroflexi bacterium]|nr:RidA family protein [Chloroflexota bacterium]